MSKGTIKRCGLNSISWIFLAGGLLLLWFLVLSGVRDHTPLNKIYWLRADTSNIAGAHHDISQWTYWRICGDHNSNCDQVYGALPFGYAWKDDPTGAPPALVGNHANNTTSRYYYYMWRFGWVFYFLAFIFANFAFLSSILCFFRIGSLITGLLTLVATFWLALGTFLGTAVFVKARNRFHDAGRSAKIGPYAFGFSYAALVLLFIASCLFLGFGFIGRKHKKHDTAGPHSKEGTYATTVQPGYSTGPVQSGYDAQGPRSERAETDGVRYDEHGTPTMRGGSNTRRGLFPRNREPNTANVEQQV